MARSLQDVIEQMAEAGITGLDAADLVADGRYHRFRPEGQKGAKKSAWYILFEHTSASGRVVINGAYGKGPDTFKVRFSDAGWSVEERAAWAAARKVQEKAAAAARREEAASAQAKAARLWALAHEVGVSPYLDRKRVGAHGVRFLRQSVLVPVRDAAGVLAGCQYIDAEGGKRFNTGMEKAGKFHLIGDMSAPTRLLFAEGYATAASLFQATGWPVVVCFDAGNIEPVATALRPLYPNAQFIFAGDDDRHLRRRLRERLAKLEAPDIEPDGAVHIVHGPAGELRICARWDDSTGVRRIVLRIHREGSEAREWNLENAGRVAALACARKFKGVAVFPAFAAADADGTDWNDLHLAEGLGVVRSQCLNALAAAEEAATPPKKGAAAKASAGESQRANDARRNLDAVMREWALIYPTNTMWDGLRQRIIKVDIAKTHYGDFLVDTWLAAPGRRDVMDHDVVFDPACAHDPETQVNLFSGWPVQPDASKPCELLRAHLYDVCGEDDGLFAWVVRWLAMPLQRPGTKMRTALVVHGPEGTGKTIFFDAVRQIYGDYGRMVTQTQLNSSYTDWMSRMLFCQAEEVVTRAELKHAKGLLKGLVTNEVVNIDEKYMPLRQERNRANFVFLSNEINPLALDDGDRRYTVIWYEPQRSYSEDYYKALGAEIANGGVAGLYAWLLSQDLGDFTPHTRPYETRARRELITINMPARDRFYADWLAGQVPDLDYGPARVCDLYAAYKRWCVLQGERFIDTETMFGRMLGRHMFKGARQGSVVVREKVDKGSGMYDWTEARQTWRGMIVVPKDWTAPPEEERDKALWAAIRDFQAGLDLYIKSTRQLMVAA